MQGLADIIQSILIDLGCTRYQWFRRWLGHHWELWCVDVPVCSEVWHEIDECSRTRKLRLFDPRRGLNDYIRHYTEYTGRPTPLCRGTPRCEDWPTFYE